MTVPDHAPALRRAMGLRDTTWFLVVAVASPRWIATAAATGPVALLVWLAALVAFFVPLACTVLELSSRYPEEGGIYVWTRRAFGDFVGFMTGWMYWASNLVYFPGLLYFTAGNALLIVGARGTALANNPGWYIGVSLVGLGIAFVLNLVGLEVGKRLHNAGAFGTWAPVAILVGVAAVAMARFGPATEFHAGALLPRAGMQELVFWSTIAFGFAGLEAASLMGEEIVDAPRTIPRAIVLAGAVITAFYVLGTLAVLVALPQSEVTGLLGFVQATGRAGERIGLPAAGPVCAALVTLGSIGGVGAWLASTARLPFVAGLDRYLPEPFARLHPRWGTPVVALLVQTLGAAAFIVLGQAGASVKAAYDALVSMAVIVYFVPYLLMFAAMIRLQREPAGPGVIRAPGGSVGAVLLGALGLATTALSIGLALLPPPDAPHPVLAVARVAGASALLVAIGVVLYARGRSRRGASDASAGESRSAIMR